MKLLTPTQTKTISAAARSDFYVDGVSHPFTYDLVSQQCMDGLLGFLKNTNPKLNLPELTIEEATASCGSESMLIVASLCLKREILNMDFSS